ncbi:MAG TPA: hypothetical protein VL576_01865 [Candidatus Paceibacterota bacterium]|jgi:hypothetical protein|nr:hypothetical protein [Candidatus Paceibacterota bacterium]
MKRTKISNEIFLEALDGAEDATSFKQIKSALSNEENETISNSFASSLEEDKSKHAGRTVLFVVTLTLVLAAGLFSFKGSRFVASWGPAISLLCVALDVSVAYFLYRRSVRGTMKIICVAIEVVSLLYFGYTITILFGSDTAPVVARSYISADYNAVEQNNHGPMVSIADLLEKAKKQAGVVALSENEHGGHGVVFAKATLINQIVPGNLPAALPKEAPQAPSFKSIEEANKWLQSEQGKLAAIATSYNSYYNAIREDARGVDSAIVAEMRQNSRLSEFQMGSLRTLESSMSNIASKPELKGKSFTEKSIDPEDLKENGIAGFIGWVVELVPIFFIFLLAYLPDSREPFEKLQEKEIRNLIKNQLNTNAISFDPSRIRKADLEDLIVFARRVFTSLALLKYLKDRKASFDQLFDFNDKNPHLLYYIEQGDCVWTMTQINASLENDPDFADNMEEAIRQPKRKFSMV